MKPLLHHGHNLYTDNWYNSSPHSLFDWYGCTHLWKSKKKKELKVCQGLEKYFTKVRRNQNIQAM